MPAETAAKGEDLVGNARRDNEDKVMSWTSAMLYSRRKADRSLALRNAL